MLSSNAIRVKNSKLNIIPQLIEPNDPHLIALASHLIETLKASIGKSRSEIEEDQQTVSGSPQDSLIEVGFHQLLEDYCQYEAIDSLDPQVLRDKLFLTAVQQRKHASQSPKGLIDRNQVITQVASELGIQTSKVEEALFSDLRGEQRLIQVNAPTVADFLDHYNLALIQSIILKATRLEAWLEIETVRRFRDLSRMLKFHRLLAEFEQQGTSRYHVVIEGPMNLFRSSQKYGLQLSLFFPHLLLCKSYEITAHLKWGPKRTNKILAVDSTMAIRTPHPSYSEQIPVDLQLFINAFSEATTNWKIELEPTAIPLNQRLWVPDLAVTHQQSGQILYIEMFGFWRQTDVNALRSQLQKHLKNQYLLLLPESYQIEDETPEEANDLCHYKRSPSIDKVLNKLNRLLMKS